MKLQKKTIYKIIAFVVFNILLWIELIYSNSGIDTEHITISDNQIPKGFDGCVIVQVSDFHSSDEKQCDRIINEISAQNPDYIFLTGDMCDSIRLKEERVEKFFERVSKIAPCYLVWGNHDLRIDKSVLDDMRKSAVDSGINVLENEYLYLERNDDKIMLTGTSNALYTEDVDDMLKSYPEFDGFSIWLHHYPEDFGMITNFISDTDLVFTGHAHGGLIRLPFTDGLYAPGQGAFPEYTSGLYEKYDSRMIVSRGIGNSGYTLRLFDRFHLVVCTLECE